MRILYDGIELTSSDLARGRVGPSGLSVNGQQVVDAAEFFRALTTDFFGRGGRSVDLSFSVRRLLPSLGAALRFHLTHHNDLPDEGDLVFVLDGVAVSLPGAVLESAERGEWSGSAATVRYVFRGSAFVADVVPPDEPDPSMIRQGLVNVPAAAETVAVVFSSPLGGPPFVTGGTLMMPTAGGDVIFWSPIEDTISAAGFTAALSGPPSGAGYKLPYSATFSA